MSDELTMTMTGNLTADPELRTTSKGMSVVNFTIAHTTRSFNRSTSQWEDGSATFMRCSAWRDLADHIASSLSKGMAVVATGRISQRSYQVQDGSTRTVIEMTVDDIGASLKRATSQVTRIQSNNHGAMSTAPQTSSHNGNGQGFGIPEDDPSDPFNQPAEF
ncbi:single-stranded DNA-binding protein [Bifidobacterium mongoliense]|uniref:Single-stranded DNA-binding protein n=1 Tax=Bifidobacterium mongoliense DSM 21395 TaxID=1437603 RepID=A0A087BZW8_9BIFI|nr:single-stranded DNA-binding protein [Bifidobacterium mongoliense]KFI76568.1 single-stranded DNA-binding protein [Bifidobacterium mongoliense DSM 21395]